MSIQLTIGKYNPVFFLNLSLCKLAPSLPLSLSLPPILTREKLQSRVFQQFNSKEPDSLQLNTSYSYSASKDAPMEVFKPQIALSNQQLFCHVLLDQLDTDVQCLAQVDHMAWH